MSTRRGASLIETVVVIGVGAILFGLAAGLLHVLFAADRAARSGFAEGTSLGRMAQGFRDDVRAATRSEPADAAAGPFRQLSLILPGDRTVEYRVEEDALARLERRGGEVVRRERFTIPPRLASRLELRREGGRTVAAFVLDRRPGVAAPKAGEGRALRVEAVVARDYRFENKDMKK
jgi:hypothetical protein